MSQFKSWNRRTPTESDPALTQTAGTRANFMAIAAAMAMGGSLPGWNYTNSFTRGEASPGTADQPTRVYFSLATDTKTVWTRAALTWDASGYPTKMAFSWSDDGEATYDNMDDLYGNNVLTIAYDASHNVTGMTWGTS
jgi:hypothetical protein